MIPDELARIERGNIGLFEDRQRGDFFPGQSWAVAAFVLGVVIGFVAASGIL
jgi:hypothetical protein